MAFVKAPNVAIFSGEGKLDSKPGQDGVLMMQKKATPGLMKANGVPKQISLGELKQHMTATDVWIALDGKVYNITTFLKYHPGGPDILLKKAAGRDATSLFNKYHPNVKAHSMLQKCFVGHLEQSEGAVDADGNKTASSVAKTAKSFLAKLQL